MKANFFSHIGQDMWVAEILNYKQAGFFLDFGSFDGVNHSNSYFFEKYLGWRGICVEANPNFYAANCAVRNCISVNYALWGESRQSVEMCDAHGLSSIVEFTGNDSNAALRKEATSGFFHIDTINPTELLDRFNVPENIEYLSLDTEGCEHIIIENIDLEKYAIALMTIEHNHNEEKQLSIRRHLSDFGYEVVEHRNDDYFYHPSYLERLGVTVDPGAAQRKVFENYPVKG